MLRKMRTGGDKMVAQKYKDISTKFENVYWRNELGTKILIRWVERHSKGRSRKSITLQRPFNKKTGKPLTDAKYLEYAHKLQIKKQEEADSSTITLQQHDLTVPELIEKYIKDVVFSPKKNLKGSTKKGYKEKLSRLQKWPELQTKVTDVDTDIISKKFDDRINSGGSRQYIKKLHEQLYMVFDYAIKEELLEVNPIADIDKIEGTEFVEKEPLTNEMHDKLLQEIQTWPIEEVVCTEVMLGLGLRTSEIIGLSWKDFQLDEPTYSVTINHQYIAELNSYGGKIQYNYVDRTKTAKGKRKLIVISDLRNLLLEYQEQLKEQNTGWNESYPLFLTNYGNRRKDKWVQGVAKKAREITGLYDLTPREFRHIYPSMLLHAGLSDSSVANAMGHTTISTTMRRYLDRHEATIQLDSVKLENFRNERAV